MPRSEGVDRGVAGGVAARDRCSPVGASVLLAAGVGTGVALQVAMAAVHRKTAMQRTNMTVPVLSPRIVSPSAHTNVEYQRT
jgi:hypothetical protein